MSEVPVVETERLRLRGWRADDAAGHERLVGDPEVMRFFPGVQDADQAWRTMALYAGHWTLRDFGLWVVERRADSAFLGRVGLWQPEGWPGTELGWSLVRDAWGQGYATEAALAARDWAWAHLDVAQLISLIRPENVASVAVARRVGMDVRHRTELLGFPVDVYALDRQVRT